MPLERKKKECLLVLEKSIDWYERRAAVRTLGKLGDPSVINTLIDALDDKDDDVKQAAILSLGKLGDRKIVEHLLKPKIYNSPNPDIRWAANYTLGTISIGGDIRIIEEVLGSLNDPAWIVRNAASMVLIHQINHLMQEGSPDSVKILLRILSASEHDVHERVIQALIEIGWKNSDPLIEALGALSKNVRAGAARVIGELQMKRAVPMLLDLLDDDDRYVRRCAVEALGKLQSPRSIYKLISHLSDVDRGVCKATVNALSNMGKLAIKPLFSSMKLKKGNEFTRNVLLILGRIGDISALPILLENLGNTYYSCRRAAMEALLCLDRETVMDNLIEMLHSSPVDLEAHLKDAMENAHLYIRIKAIRLLGEYEDYRVAPELKKLLSSKEEVIAKEASEALKKIGLASWKRWSVVHVLGKLADKRAVPYLIERLTDVKRNIRVEAARALGKLRDKRATEPLLKCLEDGDWMLRAECIDALSHFSIDEEDVRLKAMELLSADPSHQVRSAACRALSRSVRKEAHDAIEKLNAFMKYHNNKN